MVSAPDQGTLPGRVPSAVGEIDTVDGVPEDSLVEIRSTVLKFRAKNSTLGPGSMVTCAWVMGQKPLRSRLN